MTTCSPCREGSPRLEDIYRFGLLPQPPIDYEAINWHTATRADALFVENLVVTPPTPGVRRRCSIASPASAAGR